MDTSILASRLPNAHSGWRQRRTQALQRLHRIRNRLLMNPRFHRWVLRVPFGPQIARRRATELHNITAGFVYSQTLSACVSLKLFQHLHDGPLTLTRLSECCHLPTPGLERLLLAARSLRLIDHYDDGRWGLGELGAAMEANPGIAAMVEHHQHLYRDLADPVALLQQRGATQLSAYWPYAREQAGGETETYSELMSVSQSLIADHILDAVVIPKEGHWVDIAGGKGAFIKALMARQSTLKTTVFDLVSATPDVGYAGNNVDSQPTFVSGDMFRDALPKGATVISLIRILHDHDDDRVRLLLRRAYDALAPGGQLIVAEPMAGTPRAEAIGDAYFGLYLWAMGSGRPRTSTEIMNLLQDAGFRHVSEEKTAMPCLVRVITAQHEIK